MTKTNINTVADELVSKQIGAFFTQYNKKEKFTEEIIETYRNVLSDKITSLAPKSVIYLKKAKARALVLGVADDNNTVLISPISKYSAPATEKEVKLSDDNMVVSTWNAISFRKDKLSSDEYNVVSEISDADYKSVAMHYNAVFNGYDFPIESKDKVGAPYSKLAYAHKCMLSNYVTSAIDTFSFSTALVRIQDILRIMPFDTSVVAETETVPELEEATEKEKPWIAGVMNWLLRAKTYFQDVVEKRRGTKTTYEGGLSPTFGAARPKKKDKKDKKNKKK